MFGYQMRFDLSQGFPLLTTKRIPFRLIVSELLWFIKGDTNIRYLLQHNNNIWNEWAFKKWVESSEYTQWPANAGQYLNLSDISPAAGGTPVGTYWWPTAASPPGRG